MNIPLPVNAQTFAIHLNMFTSQHTTPQARKHNLDEPTLGNARIRPITVPNLVRHDDALVQVPRENEGKCDNFWIHRCPESKSIDKRGEHRLEDVLAALEDT